MICWNNITTWKKPLKILGDLVMVDVSYTVINVKKLMKIEFNFLMLSQHYNWKHNVWRVEKIQKVKTLELQRQIKEKRLFGNSLKYSATLLKKKLFFRKIMYNPFVTKVNAIDFSKLVKIINKNTKIKNH